MQFSFESIYLMLVTNKAIIRRDKLDSQNDSKYKQQELLFLMS